MLSKNKRPYDANALDPRTKIRRNVQDLLANNSLPCKRIVELASDVNRLDSACFADIERLKTKRKCDVMRKMLKSSKWMPPYWAQVRCWNPKSCKEELRWVAIQLPHEIISVLSQDSVGDAIKSRAGMSKLSKEHLERAELAEQTELLGIGLWADGTPCNWDRSEAVETLSMNLPGLVGEYSQLRIPIVALGKKHVSEHTWHDIHDVVKWSLMVLVSGSYPTERHDRSEWRKSDIKRKNAVAFLKAVLVEVRADWDWMAKVFGFPRHNLQKGNCWKCKNTPAQVMKHYGIRMYP